MAYSKRQAPILEQTGRVDHGTKAARETGFPTANIPFASEHISGTYSATVLLDGREYQAAVFANQHRQILESHLLDFSDELYGKEITVSLWKKIALPETFQDSDHEKTFISRMVEEVRNYFKT